MVTRQIIMTRNIPFPLSLPQASMARDEMDAEVFEAMMETGSGQGWTGPSFGRGDKATCKIDYCMIKWRIFQHKGIYMNHFCGHQPASSMNSNILKNG